MAVDNTNLFLKQIGQAFNQGSSSSGTSSSSSLSYEQIAWFSQALQDGAVMAYGDNNQKSCATADMVGLLFNAAFKFLSNAASAENDVQTSETKIQSTLSKYVTHRDKTTDTIDKILDEIENGDMKTIAEALDKIEALGGDSGDLAEVKKQIEEKQEEITQCMDAVKEGQANGDPSKILTNLAKIEQLRGEFAELIKSVD